MAYTDRDWDNTSTKVTKEDFKRMETGIKSNDTAIAEQAIKIEYNTNEINDLKDSPNFTGTPKIQGKQIATSTMEDTLWEGSIVNGTITLTQDVSQYNTLIIQTQPVSGYNFTGYTLDRTPNTIQINTSNYSVPISGGKGLDISFTTATTATISNNTGILRRIVGIKKG